MSTHTGTTGSFGQLIGQMDQLGFFSGLLPFVVTYTIFFFMLRKVARGIDLGDDDSNAPDMFAAILSIAFAFFTSKFIMAHPYFQDFFTQFMGRFTIIVVGILALLVMLGWVGIDLEERNSVGYVLALLVVAAFAVSGGISSFLPLQSRNEIISSIAGFLSFTIETGLIFVVLIFGLLWWTMGAGEDGDDDSPFYIFSRPGNGEGGDGSD
jgi:hypothetical protein